MRLGGAYAGKNNSGINQIIAARVKSDWNRVEAVF